MTRGTSSILTSMGRTVAGVAASLERGGVVELLDGGGTCDEQQRVGRLSGVHRQRRVVDIGRAVPREILDGDHQREALRDIAREVDRAGRLADGGEDGGDFIIVSVPDGRPRIHKRESVMFPKGLSPSGTLDLSSK